MPSASPGYSLKIGWTGYLVLAMFCVLVVPVWAAEYPLILMLRTAIMERTVQQTGLLLTFLAATQAFLALLIPPYVGSACSFEVKVNESCVYVNYGWRRTSLPLDGIRRIAILTGGQGWKYIGLFGPDSVTVVTNALYPDNKFDLLAEEVKRRAASLRPPPPVSIESNCPGKLGSPSFRFRNLSGYVVAYVIVTALMWTGSGVFRANGGVGTSQQAVIRRLMPRRTGDASQSSARPERTR